MLNAKTTTVNDIIEFFATTFEEKEGCLVPLTGGEGIIFPIKRVFYAYGVPKGVTRGKHAHHNCEQILISINGALDITIKDGEHQVKLLMNSPNHALYVPAGLWCEEEYHGKESIMLVLCSHKYAKADYINDWGEYVEWKTS